MDGRRFKKLEKQQNKALSVFVKAKNNLMSIIVNIQKEIEKSTEVIVKKQTEIDEETQAIEFLNKQEETLKNKVDKLSAILD